PIAGWCDLAWRLTVRELGGVGLACTDLLSPKGLICGSDAARDLARTSDEDRPIGMQLYGSDPGVMAEGARWCADHGATIVDLNMGCPVDKVTKKDGGSKLMCDLTRAVSIAEAARAALPDAIPLTAKMRLGWDEAAYEAGCAGELAVRLAGVGVAAITVHGRTTEQRFKGACRREGIRRVVETMAQRAPGVPVIGNGDVRTADDALEMLRETGCAGVMIGRGAFGRPWVFGEAWALQTTGELPEPVSEGRKLEAVRSYVQRMVEYRGEAHALAKIRQKISWLGKDINGSHCKALKDGVRTASSVSEVYAAIDAWAAGPEPSRRPDQDVPEPIPSQAGSGHEAKTGPGVTKR
ncbi:MAG: tRNA-dihydrouridine synthase, partial [Planctomycetota bacterium]